MVKRAKKCVVGTNSDVGIVNRSFCPLCQTSIDATDKVCRTCMERILKICANKESITDQAIRDVLGTSRA